MVALAGGLAVPMVKDVPIVLALKVGARIVAAGTGPAIARVM